MFSALLLTVFVLFLTWLLLSCYSKNRNLPPGPRGLPFFGYYPFLTNKPYLDYAKLAKIYGNIFSYRTIIGKLVVVLNGVDLIKEILVNRADEFIGRIEENNLIAWISDGLGITQEEGAVWKEHRRFFLQTAKNFGFGKQESQELIHDEVKTLIKDLKKERGQPCDIKFHIAFAVNSVISQILFSKKFEKYGGNFENIAVGASRLVEQFVDQRYMMIGFIYEYIVMKLFPSTEKYRKAKKFFRKIAKEIIDEHVETYDSSHLRDYMDSYLQHAYELDKNGKQHSFTIKRLHSITINMLMEGTESVGGTIYGLLELASKHLEEQKLVQKELDSTIGRERLPCWSDRQNLPYLEAFIQELYRHCMPFNVTTHYCNFEETTIRGYRIPRRSIVISNLWSINNDSTLYPEPSKFNPKRFVDENGKKIKTEGPYQFGIGKRSCIGESLAQMEVFIIIASLLQNFTLYPADQNGYLKLVPRE